MKNVQNQIISANTQKSDLLIFHEFTAYNIYSLSDRNIYYMYI